MDEIGDHDGIVQTAAPAIYASQIALVGNHRIMGKTAAKSAVFLGHFRT